MLDFLVTIIIPAYNVEDYIHRALQSCINQTYKNIEIIVVNDGSVDDTENCILSYATQDNRIRYIVQENQGVSAARNKALKAMNGDFFLFLDADDWLEDDAIDSLLRMYNGDTTQIFASGRFFVEIDEKGIIKKWNKKEDDSNVTVDVSTEEALLTIGTDKYSLQSSCYKLYPAQLVHDKGILFDETIHFGEDGLFVYECVRNTNGLRYNSKPNWDILNRENSATNGGFNKKWLTAIDAVDIMIQRENNQRFLDILQSYRVRRILGVLNNYYISGYKNADIERQLKKELKKSMSSSGVKLLSKRHRWTSLFYLHTPGLIDGFLWKIVLKIKKV